jgi:di/tripeptidase
MGARLVYAKVIDREVFMIRGGKIHPGLENEVIVQEEPGTAGAFLVLRAWGDDHGTFTEQWRIEAPGGLKIYESLPRELHLATEAHTERLEDELADIEFDFTADDYHAIFLLDEMEVARVRFPVRLTAEPSG